MQYLIVKHSHMVFVSITIILFNLRFWMLSPARKSHCPAF